MCDQRLKLWNTMASLARMRASWRGSLACSCRDDRAPRRSPRPRPRSGPRWGLEQVDAAQERALAGAAGAQDGDHVALVRLHRDALEHLDLAELLLLMPSTAEGRRMLRHIGLECSFSALLELRPLPLCSVKPKKCIGRFGSGFHTMAEVGPRQRMMGAGRHHPPSARPQGDRPPAQIQLAPPLLPDAPGSLDELRRDDDHAGELLGQRFEPARHVDRVADPPSTRRPGPWPIARPGSPDQRCRPMPMPQRLLELDRKIVVEQVQRLGHAARRFERRPRRRQRRSRARTAP